MANSVWAKPPVIALSETTTSLPIWTYAELLEDPTRQLSVQAVLGRPSAFSSTTGRSTQLGFSPSDYWLRFRVRTNDPVTERTWVFHVLHFFANRLSLFLIDETTGLVIQQYTGGDIPMASWDIPFQEGALRLPLQPKHTYTVLLRLSGTNSKAFSPIISDTRHYYQFIQSSTYILALYFGMIVFAIVFQLIFFSFTKDRNFLFYTAYLLSFLFVVIQPGNGLPGEVYFWPDNGWLNQNGMTLSSSICTIMILLFYANGLKLKTHLRWLASLFYIVCLFMGILTMAVLAGGWGNYATQHAVGLGLLSLGLALIACIVSIVKGFKPARYYLLATLTFLVGMILLSLWHQGLIPVNNFTTYCIPIGNLSEILFFTLALADDYHRTYRQEQKAQQQLIETLLDQNRRITSAHLQGQTTERQRVAADLHDNLGTTLSALHWNLEAMDNAKLSPVEQAVYATISQQVNQAYNDVRLLSHNLLPDELAKKGLAVALQNLMQKMNRNTAVRFDLSGADTLPRLDQQTEFELYSICLELLNNTIKHANATEGHIELALANNALFLTVGDNGAGLNGHHSEGHGLQNIAARVASLGGTWAVDSGAGGGVLNRIQVPVRGSVSKA